ncbi:MAG: hypothetical protein L3J82_06985 [Planctomycetes bacterium]|nr:hypothetical protein [Planctomycetota bacterium]
MTDKKSRDIEARRKELEEELDTYAQAGVSSPGVVKAARWVSRIMYLLMGAVVVIVLWTNKDAVPLKDFEAQKNIVVKVKKQYKDLQEQNQSLEDNLIQATKIAVEKHVEAASYIDGEIAANRAGIRAKSLLVSAEYQELVRADWQKRTKAEFEDQVVLEAEKLIAEAAVLPEKAKFAAIDGLLDIGNPALTNAALRAFKKSGQESIALAILTYLGYKEIGIADLPEGASDALTRQMALKVSMQGVSAPVPPDAKTYYLSEAWVGYVLSSEGVDLKPLVEAFKTAPDENRFELLALLAEVAPVNQSAFFRQVATQGEVGEKLIAIRWMGNRRADDPEVVTVLEGLKADENSLIADTAKVALKRVQDAKKNE